MTNKRSNTQAIGERGGSPLEIAIGKGSPPKGTTRQELEHAKSGTQEPLENFSAYKFNSFYGAIREAVLFANCYVGEMYVFQKPGQKRWTMVKVPVGRHFNQIVEVNYRIRGGPETEDMDVTQRRTRVEAGEAKQNFHNFFFKQIVMTGNAMCLPSGHHDWYTIVRNVLFLAARQNETKVIKAVCKAGGNARWAVAPALSIAARRGNKQAVMTLLKAAPDVIQSRRSDISSRPGPTLSVATVLNIIRILKDMKQNVNPKMIDHLVEWAEEKPKIRETFIELAHNYPKAIARLL